MPAVAATLMQCPQGSFEMQRYPRRSAEPLQAWCGADLLLLEAARPKLKTLLVNDEQGALGVALAAEALWTDSALAVLAVQQNCKLNARQAPHTVWSIDTPDSPCDQVLMRVPKQLAYFEYQLSHLASSLPPGAILFCAGMDKHLSTHTASLIERYFGPVQRHRGQRKARLFSVEKDPQYESPAFCADSHYHCETVGADLHSLPNVFSREQLDIGSRLLLENLHQLRGVEHTADLACGNGVLGIAAMRAGLSQYMTFADESAMAIASAKRNSAKILGHTAAAQFHHGDGLQGMKNLFDRVLCNPPFHIGQSVDDFAGRRLLRQCSGALRAGGELVFVANRHLHYKQAIKPHFRRVEQIARNSKFILWRAQVSS